MAVTVLNIQPTVLVNVCHPALTQGGVSAQMTNHYLSIIYVLEGRKKSEGS